MSRLYEIICSEMELNVFIECVSKLIRVAEENGNEIEAAVLRDILAKLRRYE